MTAEFSITNITDVEFRFLFHEFPYIVKDMSISDAAKELHTSQAVLSKRLACVEKKYGVTLVERKQGAAQLITLTPAGEIILNASTEINNVCNKIMEDISRLNRLRITDIPFATSVEPSFRELVFQTQAFLKEEHPEFRLKHYRLSSRTSFDLLRNGSVELAFEPHSMMADEQGLESLPLFHEPAIVVVDESSPLANEASVSIRDVKNMSFVSVLDNTAYSIRKHLHSIAKEYAFPPKFDIKPVSSMTSLLFDRLPGNTAMFLPYSYAKTMTTASEHISIVEIKELDCQFDMRVFYRRNYDNNGIDRVMRILRERYCEREL